MGIPLWLSRWFGPPRARARDVGLAPCEDGPLAPGDWAMPMPRCLPMNFAWGLFFAQYINEDPASR
eukprot:8797590-Pyramimonas_sp.AAC.1